MLRFLLAAAMAVAPAAAQPFPAEAEEAAATLMARALEDETGYQVIEDLTTEVGPRLAGSEAEARARGWALARLRSMGFENVRVEAFSIPFWAREGEALRIVEPFPQALRITALGGTVGTGRRGVTGEVVRFESLGALMAAPMDGSLEGKVVFVDEGMTRTQDGSGYGVAVAKRSGAAQEGAKRGAIAALIRSVGTDQHRFPHTGMMRYEEDGEKIPTAALSWPDAEQLQRAMERGPVTVRLDLSVVTEKDAPSGNVIAEIPGRTDEVVLIGAHLDSWDLGTGAIDDASGVGITTGAAKLILDYVAETGEPPLRTIRLILFGSEEVGLLGGKAYAEAHADELGDHVAAAESDFGAGRVWQLETRFAEDAQEAGDRLARILAPLGVARGGNEAEGGPDLTAIAEAGVPVVTLKQNGWDYFDLHHTEDDTLDKVDPDDIAQNVAAYAAFAWLAANAEEGFRGGEATQGAQ
ncbi:M28 family peptidase [Parvularcula dongshanensis]|uniref:Carboxypeptidase Q n=1 Tax=Parvularcula dongshanensis TaxID=1173995 RepID=A0A840I1N9_9PROT|nr:M28 family peptidase [Parvularcula dongshanensis]MBB4658154.1 Zn-dependent M28 family amino/carboxypeptidase [Parvularcula dongshanensis]